MGLIAALNFTEGILKSKNCHKMKLLLLTALAAVAVAEPYYGYGYYGFPYGHQQAWPGVRAPGFSSTCFGCRGKRSAEAEAEPAYGFYGYHPYAYGFYRPYGIPPHSNKEAPKASVERGPLMRLKFSVPDTTAVGQTVWGFPSKAKRSAEAEPEAEAE